jgi:hypothetical protein
MSDARAALMPCAQCTGCETGRPPGAQRRGPLARPTADRGIRQTDGSPQPLSEDSVQRSGGPLIKAQHAAVRHVWVHHDHPVFFGQEHIGEPGRAVCLAGGHEHAAVARRELLGWHGCYLSGLSFVARDPARRLGRQEPYGSVALGFRQRGKAVGCQVG